MSGFEWEKIQELLKKNMGERLYSTWLDSASLESIEETPQGKVLKIGVPGSLHKEKIESNHLDEIESALLTQINHPFRIELVVTGKNSDESLEPLAVETQTSFAFAQPGVEGPKPKRDFLNPEYTFSTFVVGQGSQVAHAACHSVSENPGKTVNPLFVCGPSGLGKTHLLNAIGNEVRATKPHLRICYVSGERFLTDFVASLRHSQMDKFRKRYRELCDLLVIDDIHILAHKEAVQEEFFYTFNSLHELGKQVVFSSDKYPREIDGLEERVRTRLEWGLTVDIQPPDIETRMAILRYKAESEGVALPDNVVELIAQISRKSVRELEGHLATLRMYSELKGLPITYDFALSVFSKFMVTEKRKLSAEEIQKFVADKYSISTKDMKSSTRVKTIVIPRMIAMHLCRKLLDMNVTDIGRAFGGRDHTTVLHALNKIKTSLKDESFNKEISNLENTINNSEWING